MKNNLLLMALLMSLGLTACGGGGSDSSSGVISTPTPIDDGSDGGGSDGGGSDGGGSDDGGDGGDGGDDGSPDPTDPGEPMSVTKVSNQSEFDEGENGEVSYQVADFGEQLSLTYSVSALGSAGSVAYSADVDQTTGLATFNFIVPDDIESLGEFHVTLNFEDFAGDSASISDVISLVNTSGEAKVAELIAYVENLEEFMALEEPALLLERAEKLNLIINADEQQVASQSAADSLYSAIDSDIESELMISMGESTEVWSGYENLVYTESDVEAMLNANSDLLKDYMAPLLEVIEGHLEAVSSVMPTPAMSEVYIDAENNLMSIFVGNPSLGDYENGVWKYSDEYAFLQEISFPYTATCNAE
jgi:hypothetical protein